MSEGKIAMARSQERPASTRNGYALLLVWLGLLVWSILSFIGFGHVQKVLTGAADERVMQRGHDRLSVFGIVGGDEARLLQPLSRALQARG